VVVLPTIVTTGTVVVVFASKCVSAVVSTFETVGVEIVVLVVVASMR